MADNLETKLRKPQNLSVTQEIALAVADFYEYSMAQANIAERIAGKQTVFDLVVRKLPTSKVTGTFTHKGTRYEELAPRDYLINAGLEQATAYLLTAQGTPQIRDYIEHALDIEDEAFLNFIQTAKFTGDLYAMPEGTPFFAQEHQVRVHEKFEEAQLFESLLLATINPQTAVATTANDIAHMTNKLLIEGASRRAGAPQASLFNSRAARIGGFTVSSNVAHGLLNNEKVGGTHGHSYVMLHPLEYTAFKAQADLHANNVCFLLDTYNVEQAFETAISVVYENVLEHFAFRIDSGDLLAQAKWLHKKLQGEYHFRRDEYTLIASDDLTAERIQHLEAAGADIDKYLVGTYVVNTPKPVAGVYKLAAVGGEARMKFAADKGKATLPGIKQIYRVQRADGYYAKDIIALEGENITDLLEADDTAKPLLVPIIKQGTQVYDFPTVKEISVYRAQELAKFRDITHYEVIVSRGVQELQGHLFETYAKKHGVQQAEVAA